MLGFVLYFGLRPDLVSAFGKPGFLFEGFLALSVALLTAASAFFLSVPGREHRVWTRGGPLLVLSGWIVFLLYSVFSEAGGVASLSAAFAEPGMCSRIVLASTVIPGVFLLYLLWRAAPLKRAWAGGFSLLAVGALGSFAVQFICPGSHASHIFVWHFLPVLGIGAIGASLGQLVLSWRR